jgi:transcriptional regulator with XRE-family HTH domain
VAQNLHTKREKQFLRDFLKVLRPRYREAVKNRKRGELAKLLGVAPTTLDTYFSGKRRMPSFEVLVNARQNLGISVPFDGFVLEKSSYRQTSDNQLELPFEIRSLDPSVKLGPVSEDRSTLRFDVRVRA